MGRHWLHTPSAGGRRATSAAMASLAGRVVGSPRLSMRAARSWRFGPAADAGTKAMLVAWTSIEARRRAGGPGEGVKNEPHMGVLRDFIHAF